MQAAGLVPKVRVAFARLMNGYLGLADADIETLIQRPALGDNAGLIGAVTLARQNLKEPAWSG